MKVYIFPGSSPNVHFALTQDGMILKTFGTAMIKLMEEEYNKEYDVEVVSHPGKHMGVSQALKNNKLRTVVAKKDGDEWAKVELFRWQYGELPDAGDTRKLDVVEAAKLMAVGIVSGEATRENAAMVMAYLATLLPTLED